MTVASDRALADRLVKDLQRQVATVTDDLRARSDDPTDAWGVALRAEYERAFARGRTGFAWSQWRDGEVDLAAVAWVVASVFVRFCEDNGLVDGPWITGEGARHGQAADNETDFYRRRPTANARDWLRAAFHALADLPAGRGLVDVDHSPVWRADISADAAQALLGFWRRQDAAGALVYDFADPELRTRFLGDVYQDLSEFAKKKYALLQTPVFVEEFILDRTLTPAIAEFGLEGLRLIDPACGSGHFLLGAFDRLLEAWRVHAPGMDARTRVQKALDSIHGVDLNPFAVAIARFRLTVAALRAAGITSLADAPHFDYHVAIGDSLIQHGRQGDLLADSDADEEFAYASEDIADYPGILDRGRYHVVVGNPPYIPVDDRALNQRYRQDYKTCYRQYALSVPFLELFFSLALKGNGRPAGYVGQITSNSFMKREFGSKVIEDLLSGTGALEYENPVDLTAVVDSEGAWIPGHNMDGTPTVMLFGRRRRPTTSTVRAVLSKTIRETRAEGQDGRGPYWTAIVSHIDDPGRYDCDYLTITDLERHVLSTHPWSLSGGGTRELTNVLASGSLLLGGVTESVGGAIRAGADEAYMRPRELASEAGIARFCRPFVLGEAIRDFVNSGADRILFPYDGELTPVRGLEATLWPWRTTLAGRATFQGVMADAGLGWTEYMQFTRAPYRTPLSLTFAEVATHNHVVLDRGGKVFKQTAPVIKLPAGATEDEHLDLLGVLNSSTACFWLKQLAQPKGGAAGISWLRTYQFNATKWQDFPLPPTFPRERARHLDALAQRTALSQPAEVLSAHVSAAALDDARRTWLGLRAQLVGVQEELDWEVYRAYGLVGDDVVTEPGSEPMLELGQRAFEIALARKVADGAEETAWFERHGSTPITDVPAHWPDDYRALVQRRLDLIASDPFIGLLERPEFKRRWQSATFDDLLPGALRDFVLDKLEEASLWSDAGGPAVLSVAQLADRVRGDADLVEAVRLLRGAVEVDLTAELGRLLADEAVPYLAALRYKDSGQRKRAEWESVWDLQRREDAGESVSIPVPPKYAPADFRKTAYWKARGKLDVPKERFVSYPGAERSGDRTLVLGWAGWDHLAQARALARLILERSGEGELRPEAALPLVAGLVELEPWLHQWHDGPDPLYGGSPAAYLTGFVDQQLALLSKTRDDARGWRP